MQRKKMALDFRYLRITPEIYEKLIINGPGRSKDKDLTPAFIKMRCDLLRNYQFHFLPDTTKGHFFCLCLLAAQVNNELPDNPEWLAQQIGAKEEVDIALLMDSGFLEMMNPDHATLCQGESVGNEEDLNAQEAEHANNSSKAKQPEKAARVAARSYRFHHKNSGNKESRITQVVDFLQEEIQKGNQQFETLTHKAFHHLSAEEWEQVKNRLNTLVIGTTFFVVEALTNTANEFASYLLT